MYEIIYWHDHTWTTTKWLGVPALKYPSDAWTYQEILFETRPDLIIETGTYQGGSALFLATICDSLGNGRVITIDVDDRAGRPSHSRVTYLKGSSTGEQILTTITEAASAAQRIMVILDSDHAAEHVYQELVAYNGFVSPGCYLVCEDTNVNGHPVYCKHGPGPTEALMRFLPDHPEFVVDYDRQRLGITAHPRGFLRRLNGIR
jgi:cephalosporin hydroxylase